MMGRNPAASHLSWNKHRCSARLFLCCRGRSNSEVRPSSLRHGGQEDPHIPCEFYHSRNTPVVYNHIYSFQNPYKNRLTALIWVWIQKNGNCLLHILEDT